MASPPAVVVELRWGAWVRHRRHELKLSATDVTDALRARGVASSRMTLWRAENDGYVSEDVRDALTELLAERPEEGA